MHLKTNTEDVHFRPAIWFLSFRSGRHFFLRVFAFFILGKGFMADRQPGIKNSTAAILKYSSKWPPLRRVENAPPPR